MNKLPECERPSVSLLACRRAQHATPQPKRSADCPRSRGVYALAPGTVDGVVGSSPLAQGLPYYDRVEFGRGWIIPARAGFTIEIRFRKAGHWDHPRSRGVYAPLAFRRIVMKGSSPLARGLPKRLHQQCHGVGIIPARAGFTRAAAFASRGLRDHPRSRGVYLTASAPRLRKNGSSPLARGLRILRPYAWMG